MKNKKFAIAVLTAGLFAAGCVDHSEDFQSPAPAATPTEPAAPAPQPVTPAATQPTIAAPATTMPTGTP